MLEILRFLEVLVIIKKFSTGVYSTEKARLSTESRALEKLDYRFRPDNLGFCENNRINVELDSRFHGNDKRDAGMTIRQTQGIQK